MPRLADFWGIHHGEAIVVCGLGNSLHALTDPHRFRTIGVNDIERAFTPTYMFCMDAPRSFTADRLRFIQGSRARFIFTDHDLGVDGRQVVRFPIRRAAMPRFDNSDALYFLGRPVTSPYMAVCLAAHMGAKAIGLIGVDFTLGHFFAADGAHKLARQVAGIDRRLYDLGSALLNRGVKVFNLSAESRLRAFPRIHVEDFFELQESGRARSWTRPPTRIYLYSSTPAANVCELARLVNTRTALSSRVSAPESPDIVPGCMPEIEQMIADDFERRSRLRERRAPRRNAQRRGFPRRVAKQDQPACSRLPDACARRPGASGHNARDCLAGTCDGGRGRADGLKPVGGFVEFGRNHRRWAADVRSFHARPTAGSATPRFMDLREGESFVAARNRAARCSKDLLVFTDANIQAPERWASELIDVFRGHRAAAAVAPATADLYEPTLQSFGLNFQDAELNTVPLAKQRDEPYPVPLLPGAFLAVTREVFEQVGGLDAGMRKSGADDLELCMRLWTSGFECLIAPELSVSWMNPFAAGALRPEQYWPDLLHNLLRLATAHFSPRRLGDFLASASLHPEYATAAAQLQGGDIALRQRQVRSGRLYGDDWFFERFGA